MLHVRVCEDLEEGERLWQGNWPRKCLFDLWPVRACFQEPFERPPCFLVAEDRKEILGMLALRDSPIYNNLCW